MDTNEKLKKNGLPKIIVILIIVLALILIIGFAFARYVTSLNGKAKADIAKWSFKVYDGLTHTENIENLSIIRTDNNTEVDSETIAPGTFGKFQIDIDANRN